MTPFDIVNTITFSKKNVYDVDNESLVDKDYVPFLINKALSYYPDTIMYSNEMNMHGNIDKKLQYHYLLNSIRPAKRFAKWVKKEEDNDLTSVMEFYGYNIQKAKQALSILSKEQLLIIKQKLEKGG